MYDDYIINMFEAPEGMVNPNSLVVILDDPLQPQVKHCDSWIGKKT